MLSKALLDSHEISFFYKKPGDGKGMDRTIQPYHLGCIGGVWYLIGLDLARKAIRTFALARISEPKNLRRKFSRPKDFSLETMLGDSFSAFETDNAQQIRILLDPIAAALTGERRWHPSQKLVFRKDGSAELSLKVGMAPDLQSWILGWGSHAKVLAPIALRKRIKATAQTIAAQYR
jgi:proteasome accessory factor B